MHDAIFSFKYSYCFREIRARAKSPHVLIPAVLWLLPLVEISSFSFEKMLGMLTASPLDMSGPSSHLSEITILCSVFFTGYRNI